MAPLLHLDLRNREDRTPQVRRRSLRPRKESGGRNRRRPARVVLNGAQSHRTLIRPIPRASSSARACSTSRSPAATSSHRRRCLQANGVEMLPIPDNYYDDLEARFGLTQDFLDKLKRFRRPLRPRRGGRICPVLYPALRGSLLLRDRAAEERLSRLRRRQRFDPPGGPVTLGLACKRPPGLRCNCARYDNIIVSNPIQHSMAATVSNRSSATAMDSGWNGGNESRAGCFIVVEHD